MKKILFLSSLIFFLLWPGLSPLVLAFQQKETYPKLANYYLQPLIPAEHYNDLARYDLLILDVDSPDDLRSYLKDHNQDINLFAYIPSQGINSEGMNSWGNWRKLTYRQADENNWWLYDSQGHQVSFSDVWPNIKFIDPGQGWSDFLSDKIQQEVEGNEWQGVFYDMVFANLSWLNDGDLDLNQDSQADQIKEVNAYWQRHMTDLLKKTNQKIEPNPLVANVDIASYYTNSLNGVMMENFPADWLGEDGWSILMDQYLNKLPQENNQPLVYVVNVNTKNKGPMTSFQEMRFGLASTLLGQGYFSFDYGDENHGQVWWYDEYEVKLGRPTSDPYNLLNSSSDIKPGLWRRDFENGSVMVNSTNQKQTHVFKNEVFKKINGSQDRRVNNGVKINWLELKAQDGIVLLKNKEEIQNKAFTNGAFVRVLDWTGWPQQNGFFAFENTAPSRTQVLKTNGMDLIGQQGKVYLNQRFFSEYERFQGDVFIALGGIEKDKDLKVITAPGFGGGPHVKVFSQNGQLLSEFMAYDDSFRGGTQVALGDVNHDGFDEIITAPGFGGGPHVKVFSQNGQLLSEFMAYDNSFRGGASVACGDVNDDGWQEIITGPGPGLSSRVKTFNMQGELLKEFLAYGADEKSGIMVIANDLNRDGVDEILVNLRDF